MANKEIGRIGQRRYGGTIYEEFLHELRGTRGIEVYREMSENDDVVGAILFAIEMLVRQCDWNVEPGGDTAKDKEAAEFVESCMHDMQDTWTDTVTFTLKPGDTAEIKLTMAAGDVAEYAWTAEGGRVNFDLHAHSGGESIDYERGAGATPLP